MNLHHLKYFMVIATEGSLSAASKKLLVGQPALSAQLKSFEEWLGVSLFVRQGKKLQITPTGEYVLKYAKAIKGLEDELLINLKHATQLHGKELSVGIQESVPKSIMALAISKIRKVLPVHLKITEGTGEELFEKLLNNKVDIFMGNFRPMSAKKEIFYKSLGKEPVCVWGAKKDAKLRKNFPQSLEGKSFILPGFYNPIRNDFEKFMLESGVGFEISIEAQDTALQKELASNGEGLILMGDESTKAWVSAGRLIKIGEIPLKEEYWLGMVKKAIDNEYIKLILSGL